MKRDEAFLWSTAPKDSNLAILSNNEKYVITLSLYERSQGESSASYGLQRHHAGGPAPIATTAAARRAGDNDAQGSRSSRKSSAPRGSFLASSALVSSNGSKENSDGPTRGGGGEGYGGLGSGADAGVGPLRQNHPVAFPASVSERSSLSSCPSSCGDVSSSICGDREIRPRLVIMLPDSSFFSCPRYARKGLTKWDL